MGHRLSKIYTRTGDNGTTGMTSGARVRKDDPVVAAIGDVDELNSCIALVLSYAVPGSVRRVLAGVQQDLFEVGAALSTPGYKGVGAERVQALESWLDSFNEDLPPLKEFVLPGGGPASAHCHLARAVCRRAERAMVRLLPDLDAVLLQYINRLSDLLFVLCRVLAREAGEAETLWRASKMAK